jgi:hypothetical protein
MDRGFAQTNPFWGLEIADSGLVIEQTKPFGVSRAARTRDWGVQTQRFLEMVADPELWPRENASSGASLTRRPAVAEQAKPGTC